MPIYEYSCTECGHNLEILQKLSDPKLTDCPECGKPTLRKQISAAGFRLKGGGWYATDFNNKGGNSTGKKEDKKSDTKAQQAECGAGACAACAE